jgi:hypothetical protein
VIDNIKARDTSGALPFPFVTLGGFVEALPAADYQPHRADRSA